MVSDGILFACLLIRNSNYNSALITAGNVSVSLRTNSDIVNTDQGYFV